MNLRCPRCRKVRLPLHRCPPLVLTEQVQQPAAPAGDPMQLFETMRALQENANHNMTARFYGPSVASMFSQQNVAAPPAQPLTIQSFTPSGQQQMRLMREVALLDGGGRIGPGMTDCSHGTPGYALLYLEWEGLARRTIVRTGPHQMLDVYLQFTLTETGEKARAALLAPIETPGGRHNG